MTTRSWIRKLFVPTPRTIRKERPCFRPCLETLEDRITPTVTILGNNNVPTGIVQPAGWMAVLPDSNQLTVISTPGTYKSASGPSLNDALLGSGSSAVVSTGPLVDAAEAAHLAAAIACEAAMAAGGANPVLNGAAIAANTAALAADSAAGITGLSSGAGLALGLTSDITGVASAIAGTAQAGVIAANAPDDAAAAVADTAAASTDTTAGAAHGASATADDAAVVADNAANKADKAEAIVDKAVGVADGAAGVADGTAGVADGVAAVADGAAAVQGAIDPVADGLAATADGLAATADGLAVAADTAAATADTAAATADTAAAAADVTADVADGAAGVADGAAGASDAAADAVNATVGVADTAAATTHTATAVADGVSAAAYAAAAAADGFTAAAYGAFVNGMNTPDTTGNNPVNSAFQATLKGFAVTEAATHAAAATAETAAFGFDTAAAVADTAAAVADTAAVTAVAAASTANAAAVASIGAGLAANAALVTARTAAITARAAAVAANAAAATANVAAGTADGAATIADALTAAADGAAATADATAIALDIAALATVEIPIVDIATAAAALAADGVAAGLDVTATTADVATAITDGLATTADEAATPLDVTATAADAAAAVADAAEAVAYAAASAALAASDVANAAAATADAAAAAACTAAEAAGTAAEAADNSATIANKAATAASAVASLADISFTGVVTQFQAAVNSLQTQTSSIADQLNAGIRSLDLRGAQVNDAINLNDGQYFTGVTLQSALNDMTAFLQANPSETIVVSLGSNENPQGPVNSSNSFNTDLNTLLNSTDTGVQGNYTYRDFLYSSSNPTAAPTLGQVRGKIVIVPDQSWTPAADSTTGLTIGWQPTQVVQDSPGTSDPAARWNLAENNGDNSAGFIPTDLGNPSTLYRNNLAVAGTSSQTPLQAADGVNAIAEQAFSSVNTGADQAFPKFNVSRTTGIVGMDNPDANLIAEIVDENNLAIRVTSDSDAPGATGTLRAAIDQVNTLPGVNTIEFAPNLTGKTGQTIVLQSDLPVITSDLNIDGGGSVFIQANNHQVFQNASTHDVFEDNFVASDNGPLTQAISLDTTPVYVTTHGISIYNLPLGTTPGAGIFSGYNFGTYNGSPFAAAGTTTTDAKGLPAALGFSYVGILGTPYAASPLAPINAGSYAVTAVRIASNQTTTTSSAAPFILFKASSTTTTLSGYPLTYNGSVQAGGFYTVTGAGAITGNTTLTYSANSDGTVVADLIDAGTYYVTAHFAGDVNHKASDGAAVQITIRPAHTLMTTVGAGPFTYNGKVQVGGSGLLSGVGVLDVSAISVTYSANSDGTGVADQTDAGVYYVTAHFAGDANHTASDGQAVSITIDKADATVMVTPYTLTYDGLSHIAAVTTLTGVNGETGAKVGTVTLNTTHTNAGAYAADTWSFAGAANYNDIASTTISDVINKTDPTVVVTPYAVKYDGNAHTAAVTTLAGVNGETGATVGVVTLNSTHTNAGAYASDSWSFTGANYNDIASTTISDAINKADATVVVTPYSVKYDGASHSATVTTLTGVHGETGATVGAVTLNATHTNAGAYANDSWNFAGAANYNDVASTTISDTINKADAVIAITPYSGLYDGSAHGLTGSATGVEAVPANLTSLLHLGETFTDAPGGAVQWSFDGNSNYNAQSGSAAVAIEANYLNLKTGDRTPALADLSLQQRYVQALYLDVLGRAGSVAELNGWVATPNGTPNSQAEVTQDIENSQEGRDNLVKGWYRTYLGRAADGVEEQSWVKSLLNGSSENSTLGDILGSPEFFAHAQKLVGSGSPQERFVQGLYKLVLNRTADAGEIMGHVAELTGGQSQSQEATSFLSVSEFRTDLVAEYYSDLLHRTANAAEINGWAVSGMSDEAIRLMIESSSEFLTNG